MKKKTGNKEIEFEHAPQVKMRFVEKIWEEFLEKVLQNPQLLNEIKNSTQNFSLEPIN